RFGSQAENLAEAKAGLTAPRQTRNAVRTRRASSHAISSLGPPERLQEPAVDATLARARVPQERARQGAASLSRPRRVGASMSGAAMHDLRGSPERRLRNTVDIDLHHFAAETSQLDAHLSLGTGPNQCSLASSLRSDGWRPNVTGLQSNRARRLLFWRALAI